MMVLVGLLLNLVFSQSAVAVDSQNCEPKFVALGAAPDTNAILQELAEAANDAGHSARIEGGKAFVKIEYLTRAQVGFSRLLFRAMKMGIVAEVDAGMVSGPKVYILLNRMRSVKPDFGPPIVFRGSTIPSTVEGIMETEVQASQRGQFTESPQHWSDEDIDDYLKAIEELGIKRACETNFGSSLKRCGIMYFEFRSGDEIVSWEGQ